MSDPPVDPDFYYVLEGMFGPTMLAFAPLWAWFPLVIIQVVLLHWTDWPWYWRFFPVWLYLASFAPMAYGIFMSAYDR